MNSPEPCQIVAQALSELGVTPTPEQERGSLDVLIGLLLGNAADGEADSRIAGFGEGRLDLLERAARQESGDCLDRLRCMLELMDGSVVVGSLPLSRESLQRLSHHLLRALADHERWRSLSANAAYYRDHRDVAERVTRYLKRTE